MLPRGVLQKEASEENRRLVMAIAEAFFPGVDHIDQLSLADRKFWIPFANLLLRDDLVNPVLAKFGQVFAPAVEAEADDIVLRREAHLENERRRIARDDEELAEKKKHRDQKREDARRRRVREDRIADERWEAEREERRILLRNRSWRETAVLGMATAGFLLVFAICVVCLLKEKVVIAGGSGGSLLLIAVTFVFQQIRQDQKQDLAVKAPRPSVRG